MASVSITKLSAAQRQIDAAIRILFSGEDALAVHTVVAAAHGIVSDLAKKRNVTPGHTPYTESIGKAMATLYRQRFGITIPNRKLRYWAAQFEKEHFRPHLNRPANFLKHADQDAGKVLDQDGLQTDTLLLFSCVTYTELGLEYTPEMTAFCRWHLAVYPHEDGDAIKTDAGYVHDLSRAHQLEFGDFMLSHYREPPKVAP